MRLTSTWTACISQRLKTKRSVIMFFTSRIQTEREFPGEIEQMHSATPEFHRNTKTGSLPSIKCWGDRPGNYPVSKKGTNKVLNGNSQAGVINLHGLRVHLMETLQSDVSLEFSFEGVCSQQAEKGEVESPF